ncbi:uncharacterized protein K460DRAFT_402323 [Cucurbitaria berberidis CBS 394.84]|uniref:Uncharacterized protein n=1 Tax=Cucurbitaria berberidis CBS 394.84 TaxID=1168544 RepID=A0A9P4GIT6_9PLEO|nr:uncharacterized protein K460DRAFT_402323 [Cucurbitaria berberidis CBS 394.84]KAF1846958.1 hypothetical protein K460DRAFT_402323 [Cucurbitaria berberidis CBS 394.84]
MPNQPSQTPADPLEQRILDLLYPYRDEPLTSRNGPSADEERKVLILCENIAFLIRHNHSRHAKKIGPDDTSIASRNWDGMMNGIGIAGVGIFVNGNGFTHTVLRTSVQRGESLVDKFTQLVDLSLVEFFPGI